MSDSRGIAVLITYHNERELLTECLESVLAQTRLPDEVLVYDDASNAPADDYIPAGLPVHVLRSDTNHGPAYGRNALLGGATSQYIHFHDADDLFYPDWCRRVSTVLAESAPDVVFTQIASSRGGIPLSDHVLELDCLRTDPDLVRFCLRFGLLTPSGTYRRSLVQAIGGYRTDLWQSEDFEFHVRLASTQPHYVVVAEPLVHIRVGMGRSRQQVEVWQSALQAVEALSRELDARYRDDLADAAARAGSHLFGLGELTAARRAFRLARGLGQPRFAHERRYYRFIARALGPLQAERVAAAYRRLVPERMRRSVGIRG